MALGEGDRQQVSIAIVCGKRVQRLGALELQHDM